MVICKKMEGPMGKWVREEDQESENQVSSETHNRNKRQRDPNEKKKRIIDKKQIIITKHTVVRQRVREPTQLTL